MLRHWQILCALVYLVIFEANATNVVYINGINTTYAEALLDRNEIRSKLLSSNSYSGSNKRDFSISLIHNPIGWFNNEDDEATDQDRQELFLLKTAEECYLTDFSSISVPHNQSKAVDKNAAARVNAFLNNIVPGPQGGHDCGANGLSDGDALAAGKMSKTKRTAIALADKVLSYSKAIVVAHSQGNLLAHLAYARIAASIGDATTERIRIVNVANTSKFSANSLDMSHAGDLALDALKVLGQRYKRTTPHCSDERCNFSLAGPTLSSVHVDGDLYDHGLVLTYLSNESVSVIDAQGVSFTPQADKFQDRFVDFVYAAASSLDLTDPSVITFVVTGKIFQFYDELNVLPSVLNKGYQTGGDFISEFSFDPLAVDVGYPYTPSMGSYRAHSGTVRIGANEPIVFLRPNHFGAVFDITVGSLRLGASYDEYSVDLWNNVEPGSNPSRLFHLGMIAGYRTGQIESDALPLMPPDPSYFGLGGYAKYQVIYICPTTGACGQVLATVDKIVKK